MMFSYDFPLAKAVAYTASEFGEWKAWPPERGEKPETILYEYGGVLNRKSGPGALLGGQTVAGVLDGIRKREKAAMAHPEMEVVTVHSGHQLSDIHRPYSTYLTSENA